MRVYLYAGPSKRLDADWVFLHLALNRLPDVESYLYECHGQTDLHGKRDVNLVMDHDLELFGEALPSWRPPRPFTLITSHQEGASLLWEGAQGVVRLLPAADPLLWQPDASAVPSYDVGRIGALDSDIEVLDAVFHAFPSFTLDRGTIFEDAVKDAQRAKVLIVDAVPRHLLEVLCLGKPVVARAQKWHRTMGLESGRQYLSYDTPEEAVEAVRMALTFSHIAEGLGLAGRAWAMSSHTWIHRAYEVAQGRTMTNDEMQRLLLKPLRVESERERQLGMPLLPVRVA